MADYTWRQWEAEQDDANLLHASDCERWQAGIELAGGTWDGEWVDLDKTGKGLVIIDQFNALESQIQSKVSSYTPKNYDPDSTVQIVPGPDGWNKVEDGILKAVCEPDGVNRNWAQGTRSMAGVTSRLTFASQWVLSTDEDGFGVRTCSPGSGSYAINFILPWDATEKIGTEMVFSCDIKFTGPVSDGMVAPSIFGSNNGTSWSRAAYTGIRLSQTPAYNVKSFNTGDYIQDEWWRLNCVYDIWTDTDLQYPLSTEYAYLNHGFIFYFFSSGTGTIAIRKPKLEIASENTDWSEAPEDYGYPDAKTLSATATPQSIPDDTEDSDEVAAPEAEEIE